jgi:hypothetical protein
VFTEAKLKFDDATATELLMLLFFSGFINLPRLEKDKDKKRAAGVPATSVATPPRGGCVRHLCERALHGAAQRGRGPTCNLMYFCAKLQLHRVRVY